MSSVNSETELGSSVDYEIELEPAMRQIVQTMEKFEKDWAKTLKFNYKYYRLPSSVLMDDRHCLDLKQFQEISSRLSSLLPNVSYAGLSDIDDILMPNINQPHYSNTLFPVNYSGKSMSELIRKCFDMYWNIIMVEVVGYKLGSIFSGGIITLFVHDVGWTVLCCIIATFYVEAAMLVFVSPTLCSHERQELDDRNFSNTESKCYSSNLESRSIFKEPLIIESGTERGAHTSSFFTAVFSEQGTIWLLMFLLVYKLGEQGALSVLPIYLLDVGISTDDVTLWISIVGQALSIAGSIMGGVIIKFTRRVPTEFMLQQFCMLRLLPVGCQLLVVIAWDHKLLSKNLLLCALVVSSQLLLVISGIVTTTTFTLVMEISKRVPKRVQATHYATMSAIEVLGKLMFVSTSGWIVDTTGYNVAFLLFVFLNILVLPLFAKLPKGVGKIGNLQKPQVDLKTDKKLC